MPAQYYSQYHMPFDPDVPDKDRRMSEEVAEDYDRRQRNASEARNDRLSEIHERTARHIRELMGEENWLSLRRRVRGERIRFQDLLQPPAGLDADYTALDAQRKANVQAYFDSLNINVTELRRILAEAREEVKKVLPETEADKGFATWLQGGQLPTAEQRPVTDDPHAFVTFRPPFPGFQRGVDPHNIRGFRVAVNQFLDPSAGLVGQEIMLDDSDASDFDNGWAVVDTQVAFNFRAPATGTVEIVIEARCGIALHHLLVLDEWGVSDSRTQQENFLMAHVLHPNVSGPSFASMSRFNWNTDDSGNIDRQFLTQGGVFGARLFSNGPVQAGQIMTIRAGTRGADGSITNDMEIHSKSTFRWSLSAVSVRIAP